MADILDPVVIEPEGFDLALEWRRCREYVEQSGGLTHDDGTPNWRAAFGADPGCCSCPACKQVYWAWGRRIRCSLCAFEFETDWWPMYSSGVSRGKGHASLEELHRQRLQHPYYRYGFEHPVESAWTERDRINWRAVSEGRTETGAES